MRLSDLGCHPVMEQGGAPGVHERRPRHPVVQHPIPRRTEQGLDLVQLLGVRHLRAVGDQRAQTQPFPCRGGRDGVCLAPHGQVEVRVEELTQVR